jgi:methionyl-tRNA formyltransferase
MYKKDNQIIMEIGLYIVGQKGLSVLRGLLERDVHITHILTYEDKGINDNSFKEIIELCDNNKILYQIGKKYIGEENCDKIILIGWQYLIHNDLSKYLIIHDSYLPEYKGWSPTVNYLIEGSPYLAATIFEPTHKMDTGKIYAQRKVNIEYPMYIKDAINIVSTIYIDLIIDTIKENNKPIEMLGKESFCAWRNNDDYFINWEDDNQKIKRTIDALGYPYDNAKTLMDDGSTLKIIEAETIDIVIISQKEHIGKILYLEEGNPVIICGEGALKILKAIDENSIYTFNKVKKRFINVR